MEYFIFRKKKQFFTLVLLAFHCLTAVAGDAEKLSEFEKFEENLSGSELSAKEIGNQMSEKYFRLFGKNTQGYQVNSGDPKVLDIRFQAANSTALYSNNPEVVRELAATFEQLVMNKQAKKKHFKTMYGAFLAARMIQEAQDFLHKYPSRSIEALPEFQEESNLSKEQTTVWALGSEKRILLRKAVDISTGAQLVVVSHPYCHFSRNLVATLTQDQPLSDLFKGRTTWLTPQDRNFSFDDIQAWNRKYPDFAMFMTYQRDEWPAIDFWGTPSFYFFRDGVLLGKVVGWPKEGRKQELLEAFKKIGIE